MRVDGVVVIEGEVGTESAGGEEIEIRARPSPFASVETGFEGEAPQHEIAICRWAQSIEGLWRSSQSKPKLTGKETDTIARERNSE